MFYVSHLDSISASNYYGARHGIETLFQTIVWDEVSGKDSIRISKLPYKISCIRASLEIPLLSLVSGAYVRLSDVRIEDRPELPHRGLSLDTVRNFISIEKIKKVSIKM